MQKLKIYNFSGNFVNFYNFSENNNKNEKINEVNCVPKLYPNKNILNK